MTPHAHYSFQPVHLSARNKDIKDMCQAVFRHQGKHMGDLWGLLYDFTVLVSYYSLWERVKSLKAVELHYLKLIGWTKNMKTMKIEMIKSK